MTEYFEGDPKPGHPFDLFFKTAHLVHCAAAATWRPEAGSRLFLIFTQGDSELTATSHARSVNVSSMEAERPEEGMAVFQNVRLRR